MGRRMIILVLVLACVVGTAVVVGAQAKNPWEQPLTDIATSMMGPVALAGFLIGLGIFCLMWIMGAHGAVSLAIGIVIGGAILGNADTIASWLGVGG